METTRLDVPNPSTKEIIDALSDDQIIQLRKECGELIKLANDRIRYAEERRSKFLTLGTSTFAAGVSILVFLMGIRQTSSFPLPHIFLAATALVAILCGVHVFRVYGRQTNPNYPFKAKTDTWKSFYRDALDQAGKINWRSKPRNGEKEKFGELFDDDRRKFISKLTAATDSDHLQQDLEQLVLLHANDCFKNKFLSEIRDIFGRWMVALVIMVALTFSAWLYTRIQDTLFKHHIREVITVVDRVNESSTWRESSLTRTSSNNFGESQILFNSRLQNSGNSDVSLDKLVVRDKYGMIIPSKVETTDQPLPVRLQANSTLSVAGTVWVPEGFASQIVSLELR